MNLVIDLQYFPSITFYKNSTKFSNIAFDQYEPYQKMSFRNRCQVTGAGGLINLSVPLIKGREQKTIMKDVRIADHSNWQVQHWRTILSCYSRSPWFEFYRDGLEELYGKRFDFLLDWNLACFEWSLENLGLALPFTLTETYLKGYDPESWADQRGRWKPRDRAAGDGKEGFEGGEKNGVGEGEKGLRYHQVFEDRIGFISGLSILDLLFNEGKRAKLLLTGS